jgi:hypothetical protein
VVRPELTVIDTELRGIPLWLLQQYLEGVGGQSQAEGQVSGPGWQARLTQVEDFVLGSLRVGQVRVVVDGDSESVAAVWQALQPKLMRAGG